MRVAFFGQCGPYAPEALRQMLRLPGPYTLALVVEGRKHPVGRYPHRQRPPHRGPLPLGEGLADLACAAGIPALQTCDVNAAEVVTHVGAAACQALVCVGFDRLFRQPLLQVAPMAINAHPSALPRWRGPAPLFWALRGGVANTAVTLHAIDAHEDHGPIFAQQQLPIAPRVTGETLYNQAGRLAAALLHRLLSNVAHGSPVGVAQDHTQATRAPRPKAEDLRLQPLAWKCEHLVNFAVGAPYFRAPWLQLGADTFHIKTGLDAQPGQRLPADYLLAGDTLVVQCIDGVAHLQVQT